MYRESPDKMNLLLPGNRTVVKILIKLVHFNNPRHVGRGEAGGGQLPPQILADQKAPPGSGGAPHYYRPPRIFDPCCIPDLFLFYNDI